MGTLPVRLEVVAGNAAGMSILVEDELLIGRHADGAGRLAEDPEISRSHARIVRDSSGFCAVEDLGSTNGTFVNGLRISGPQTLSEGDSIELGATTLVMRDLPSAASEQSAAAEAVAQPVAQPTLLPGRASAPEPAAVATPPPPQGPSEAGAVPTLTVRLEVDFAAREARIMLDDASEPVRLRFEAGAWRTARP